jgi:PIN domain nuclease of toxin-antitoxin system
LLWWLEGRALSDPAAEQIADPSTLVVVSAASVWEASIKSALGILAVPEPLGSTAVAERFEPLSAFDVYDVPVLRA